MIYLFKTNVLRNSNTEIKGKLSLRSSYSNDFFNMPDKIFQEQEELEKLTGVLGFRFCHKNLFIASCDTLDGAIKIANLAMNQKR